MVFNSSTITMMHGPINIRFTCKCYHVRGLQNAVHEKQFIKPRHKCASVGLTVWTKVLLCCYSWNTADFRKAAEGRTMSKHSHEVRNVCMVDMKCNYISSIQTWSCNWSWVSLLVHLMNLCTKNILESDLSLLVSLVRLLGQLFFAKYTVKNMWSCLCAHYEETMGLEV